MKEAYPNKVDFFSCDISNIDTINALALYIKENYGSVELLVNDAGTAPKVRKDMLKSPQKISIFLWISTFVVHILCHKLLLNSWLKNKTAES